MPHSVSLCLATILSAALLSSIAQAACPVPPANVPSDAAKKLAINKLTGFLKCDPSDPINDQSPCNTFASKGLEAIYAVTDFKISDTTHMAANAIADFAAKSKNWQLIGALLNDDNALCAQAAANAGLPVIAVLKGAPHGHIALIIPGEPMPSPSWNKTLAPNSASFFYNKPEQVYVGGPLSKAFGAANAAAALYYVRMH